jgi:hypothetical protein
VSLKIEGARGEALLTSNRRIPASSSLRAGGGTSAAPTGASVAPAGASPDNPTTGGSTPAPGTNSTTAPSARGDGGMCSHLSEVVRSPSLSSSSSSDDEFANTGGGESPYCSRSRYTSLYCYRFSRRLCFFSFARTARSCS